MLNREYIKQSIIKHTGDNRIKSACEKLQDETGIPSYVIYNFCRSSIPREKDFLTLVHVLGLDTKVLFNI